MAFEFETEAGVNSLIWVNSLPPGEMGPTRRIVDDLYPLFKSIQFDFLYYEIPSVAHFYETLDGIAERARQGARPMLHLDMHGAKDGLWIAANKQLAPWAEIVPKLRAINVASGGNLCVVAGVCYAYHATKQFTPTKACPIHVLIAPVDEVKVGFLEDSTVKFYRDVFTSGRIDLAHKEHLSDQLKVFYSEQHLAIGLGRYIKEKCKGKGGAARRERLLTDIIAQGEPSTPDNLKRIRKKLKEGLKPDQALVDKYASTFLAGRPCPFTIDDLLRLVDGANKTSPRRGT